MGRRLVNGLRGTGNIATLVECKSRFVLFGYTLTKETGEVIELMSGLLAGKAPPLVRTATFDKGKEFANHSRLTELTGVPPCISPSRTIHGNAARTRTATG